MTQQTLILYFSCRYSKRITYYQIIKEKGTKGRKKEKKNISIYRRESNLICDRIRVEQLKEIGEYQEDWRKMIGHVKTRLVTSMSWHDQSSARFVWTRTWSRNNIAPLCSNNSTLFSSRQNEILMKNRHLNLTGQMKPRTRVNFADTTFSDRKLLLIGSKIQLS